MKSDDVTTHQKKLHVILLLNDDESIECKTVILAEGASVAQALRDVGSDKDVQRVLPEMKMQIRLYDGKVFVDNKEQALWMLGQIDHKPDTANSTVVVN